MAEIEEATLQELSDDELCKFKTTLEAELERRKRNRINTVQNEIKKLADSVGLSPEEIIMQMSKSRRSNATPPAQIRYRNPSNPNETWVGRGKRPKWLVQELDAGADIESFRVS